MKKYLSLFIVAILASGMSFGIFYALQSDEESRESLTTLSTKNDTPFLPMANMPVNSNADNKFVTAAKETVNAVVNVKNISVAPARSFFFGYGQEKKKAIRGVGSGVIISPDGYIVTNNHVIKGAKEIEVTLNNNENYKAEVIGTAPKSDIALLKIAEEDLHYLAFGDSNNVKVGEWVLAVGNPFNLTSTVTAGIVSAKARNLDPENNMYQSFIQTDAAVNPGNSGGALVNENGQLIGINTAITSRTGSYVGYSFAVPSNNARKIVEDLMEYGNVQKAVLGVRGSEINGEKAEELNIDDTQGFYVGGINNASGAKNAGIKNGDIIKKIDDIKIRRFADLTGYINTKNPGDIVNVEIKRNGRTINKQVELTKYKLFRFDRLGVEVTDIDQDQLKSYNLENGVQIANVLDNAYVSNNFKGLIITEVNGNAVNNLEELKEQVAQSNSREPISVTFGNPNGETKTYIFR